MRWAPFILVVLLLCDGRILHAQTQGLLPTVIDSYNANVASCGLHCIPTQENVSIGDLIVVATDQPDVVFGNCTGNTNGPWTVTDSLGNTYVSEATAVTPNVPGNQNNYISFAHTISAFAGADNITVGLGPFNCSEQIHIARFSNISGTTDGLASGTVGPASGLLTVSTSNTTSVNGDLLVSFSAVNSNTGGLMSIGSNVQYLSSAAQVLPEVNGVFGFSNAGLAGSQSRSMFRYGGNANQTAVMQTLAFKPSALAIVDTALPDCANGTACSMQLHGVGGAGAYTCSITAGSLQTGLSLGGSGNCTISGTPSSTSTNSITFQITDGTLTATKTLSLKVASSFGTPSVISTTLGTFDNGGGSATATVACGDVLVLQVAAGADTHGGTGWIQTQNGSSNFYVDSFGSTVTRVPGIGGIISGPLMTYLFAVTQSGVDVVTAHNGAGGSAALSYQLSVVRSVQPIADYGSFNNNTTSASSTTNLTTSFVAPVSNEILMSDTLDENAGSSIALSAPFSSVNTGNNGFNTYNFGIDTGVAAGSVSHVAAITSGALKTQSTELFGLRPGTLPAICSAFNGAGEKIRRQVW